MNRRLVPILLAVISLLSSLAVNGLDAKTLSELAARGYSVLPSPQVVKLGENDVNVDRGWSIDCRAGENNIALQRLVEGAQQLHGLTFSADSPRKIVLRIASGTVHVSTEAGTADQAYNIDIGVDS